MKIRRSGYWNEKRSSPLCDEALWSVNSVKHVLVSPMLPSLLGCFQASPACPSHKSSIKTTTIIIIVVVDIIIIIIIIIILLYLSCFRHTWRKKWVNCAVLTGNSAGLRTVLSSRLSHRELHSSLRESHSFLSLPADTTMASSQCTSVSSSSFSRWTSHDILLFIYHFLLHILRFLFLFSDNFMADMSSKQQTANNSLVLSTILTRTRRQTELTKKTDKPDGKPVQCQRIFSSGFRAVFFTQLNCKV